MKVKVYVVDFEIPPRAKRWALRIGLPVAVILGGLTVAYAALPKRWGTSAPLTSADLNANFDNLDQRLAVVEAGRAAAGCTTHDGPQSTSNGAYPTGSIAQCNSDERLTGGNCSPNSGRPVLGRFVTGAIQCVLATPSVGTGDFVTAQAICCKF